MSVFAHPEFDNHELVAFHRDPASGLQAIIAIHNTRLGPALGGCRMWPYQNEEEALTDVLRLARGMTYKSALANLPLGGGKAVIMGDPRRDKTPALLRAMGAFIDSLGGRYITAEDSGTSVADMKIIGECTRHVAGVAEGSAHGGDPSPATAYGVFVGIGEAVRFALGRGNLAGVRVAVQGVGHVGLHLVRQLRAAGAQVYVTDLYRANIDRAVAELGAVAVAPDAIYGLDVDVFAPCAMGAVINDTTLPQLRARIVAGAANNQLATPEQGRRLLQRGILYAPDYVINAGGIIDIHYQREGGGAEAIRRHIEGIAGTLRRIFLCSREMGVASAEVADAMAAARLQELAPAVDMA